MAKNTKSKTNENTTDAQRENLIREMLMHIPFDGWGDAARNAAANSIGMSDDTARGLIPDAAAAIDAFSALADRDMVKSLDKIEPRPQKVSEIIREAILCRLANAAPYREASRQALMYLARPQHAPLATRTLYRTVDRMWRLTSDRSVDFSFYTKRATLAGVYSATLLYWVMNPDADDKKVAGFLDQRLKEIAIIPKVIQPAQKVANVGFKVMSKMISRMPMPRSG